MNEPQSAQPSNRSGAAVERAPMSDEDDVVLGWECANPALQIERWHQDITAAPDLPSSNS